MRLHYSSLTDPPGTGVCLVVLLHAFTGHARDLTDAVAVARRSIDGAEILVPELPISGPFSTANPNVIAADIADDIEERWTQAAASGRPYQSVVLVGHSVGALLARKAYVVACGEDVRAPFEPEIRDRSAKTWAAHVDRIVLLAGMNRGWRVSHHLGIAKSVGWAIGVAAGKLFEAFSGRRLLIFQVRRGAAFITQLRIQWLRMRQRAHETSARHPGQALTIQLLGSIDDMVSPEDNIDLVSGRDFVYLDVPHSGHADVIGMGDTRKALKSDALTIGEQRGKVFALALTATRDALETEAVIPDDEAVPGLAIQNPGEGQSVQDVIFVIHGIRDAGYWTQKIARAVRKRAALEGRVFATETSSYGYFPMLPFLFAWKRREKVEWLMDQYAQAIARHPHADFHFVGHSNGTYCLARALELYPCCRFKRVVFAGSVVPVSYDWRRFLPTRAEDTLAGGPLARLPQVESVLNYVATGDWVVAFFPKLFQTTLPVQDLGSAGHDGFRNAASVSASGWTGAVANAGYVRGRHGAAIAEENWDAIAEFVVTGRPVADGAPVDIIERKQDFLIRFLGLRPEIVWLFLAVVLIGIGLAIVYGMGAVGAEQWMTVTAVAAYIGLLMIVATRL